MRSRKRNNSGFPWLVIAAIGGVLLWLWKRSQGAAVAIDEVKAQPEGEKPPKEPVPFIGLGGSFGGGGASGGW